MHMNEWRSRNSSGVPGGETGAGAAWGVAGGLGFGGMDVGCGRVGLNVGGWVELGSVSARCAWAAWNGDGRRDC